jgi:hypothetical protein
MKIDDDVANEGFRHRRSPTLADAGCRLADSSAGIQDIADRVATRLHSNQPCYKEPDESPRHGLTSQAIVRNRAARI